MALKIKNLIEDKVLTYKMNVEQMNVELSQRKFQPQTHSNS